MQQFAREKDNLVLSWNDGLVAACADVISVFQSRVVNSQFTAFELPRLAMKKVNERQMPGSHPITAVIAVKAKEITVIAGRDLYLRIGNGTLLHAQLRQDLRQDSPDSAQHPLLMLPQLRQHT